MAEVKKLDPIRDTYYAPLEQAEAWENGAFYVAVFLSFAVLFVEKASYPKVYAVAHVLFVLVVIASFVIGSGIRLYLSPRAEGSRRDDLFANSFSAMTAHPTTIGYYNNSQTEPFRKLGANVMESSFFSKEIALEMLRHQRWRVAVYGGVWTGAAAYQQWDLALLDVLAQAIFSEQILSKWLRLEWLSRRYEFSFRQLAQLFESVPNDEELVRRRVLEAVCFYETSKAAAGIVLSSKAFQKLNAALNARWNTIRANLNL